MPRRSRLPLVIAALVGVVLIIGIRLFLSAPGAGPTAPQAAVPTVPHTNCIPLAVGASQDKSALLTIMAGDYNKVSRSVSGRCVDVHVADLNSGTGAEALAKDWDEQLYGPRPDVWSPSAAAWAGILEQRLKAGNRPDIVPVERPSITQSPVVIAMPQPMAEALGWPDRELGWHDLADLARDPAGWGAHGHPEWGAFKLGKTNPNRSSSGLTATVAAFFAATGRSTDLTAADVADPNNRAFVKTIEGSVVHYGDITLTFLQNLYDAAARGQALTYVSAVTVEEKGVWDYNQGNPSGNPATLGQQKPPTTKLVAIYPKDGTLVSDHPYLTLNAPWVDDAKRAGAADFLAYLREPAQQERFQAAGFRSFDGKPGATITRDNGLLPEHAVAVLAPPAPDVLEKIVTAWSDLRKRANLVFVLDVSGSMGQPVNGTGRTRIDLAKEAAIKGLGLLGPDDTLSLWTFSTARPGESTPYRVLVPPGPVSAVRDDYTRVIGGLEPAGGTALYATTRAAVAQVKAGFDPSRINAVVVLTDGVNEYPPDNDLDGLVTSLGSEDRETQVRVFAIAYGQEASLAILSRISTATTAAAYDAGNAASINEVMINVISNF